MTFSPFKLPPAMRRGFTIIELLVALAITSIVVVLLISMTGVVADAWRDGNNKIFTNTEARAAFNRLTEDLESAVIRDTIEDAEWFQARVDDSSGFSTEPANPTWLMFFTVPTDRQLFEYEAGTGDYDETQPVPGNVYGVSYKIVEQDPVGGGSGEYRLFGLYRAFPDADNPAEETFNNILGIPALETYWEGRDETEDIDNFYISNIFDFSFTFWITVFGEDSGEPETRAILVSSTADDGVEEVRVKSDRLVVGSTEYPGGKLAAVEISMTILTREGAIRARDNNIGESVNEFVANPDFARTYAHKVYFTPEAQMVFPGS